MRVFNLFLRCESSMPIETKQQLCYSFTHFQPFAKLLVNYGACARVFYPQDFTILDIARYSSAIFTHLDADTLLPIIQRGE